MTFNVEQTRTTSKDFSVSEISRVLTELIDAKNTLANGLEDVSVSATQERNPDVMTAISGLFGPNAVKDGKAVITFKMFTECINVVRNSGKLKAEELIV